MWPFGKKKKTAESAPQKLKYIWEEKKYGFTDYEKFILLKLEEVRSADNNFCFNWCTSTPSNELAKCSYCSGPVMEIFRDGDVILGLKTFKSEGIFCLRCNAELVCEKSGCNYGVGDAFVGNFAHWAGKGANHYEFRMKGSGRNLRDIIIAKLAEVEGAKKVEDGQKQLPPPEPDLQDEYANLKERLEEIAAERLRFNKEEVNIFARLEEINAIFAQEAATAANEPGPALLRAADDDDHIVTESQADAEAAADPFFRLTDKT